MAKLPPRRKPVPLGPPIRLSDHAEALATITASDRVRAVAFWRAHAWVLKRLLDGAIPGQGQPQE